MAQKCFISQPQPANEKKKKTKLNNNRKATAGASKKRLRLQNSRLIKVIAGAWMKTKYPRSHVSSWFIA